MRNIQRSVNIYNIEGFVDFQQLRHACSQLSCKHEGNLQCVYIVRTLIDLDLPGFIQAASRLPWMATDGQRGRKADACIVNSIPFTFLKEDVPCFVEVHNPSTISSVSWLFISRRHTIHSLMLSASSISISNLFKGSAD